MKDVLITLLLALLLILDCLLFSQLEKQNEIDQRLTVVEQSLNETDTAVVKALQGSNEALYKLKLMEINDN